MTQALPEFFRNVGSHRGDHEHQGFDDLARHGLQTRDVVVEHDELGNGRVHAQVLVFHGDVGDRPSQEAARFLIRRILGNRQLAGGLINGVTPQALEETLRADDSARLPGAGHVQRPHAHLVNAEHIGTVGVIHFVRSHDVLQGLAHLPVFAGDGLSLPGEAGVFVALDLIGRDVLAACVRVGVCLDVALVEQGVVRLRVRNKPEVEENLLPETRVQQVQNRVFHAADVQVGAAADLAFARPHPVVEVFRIREGLGVRRVGVAHFVPARARPLGHGVGLATVGLQAVTQVEFNVHPFFGASQGCFRFGVRVLRVEGARRVVGDFRQFNGQHLFRKSVCNPLLIPDDREGFTPVALAGEEPVTQAVGDGSASQSAFFQPGGHRGFRGRLVESVQGNAVVSGVHGHAVARVGALGEVVSVGVCGITDGSDDVEVEAARELPVAVVVRGHGHDRAGSVVHEDVVGNEQGHSHTVDGIVRPQAGEDTGFLSRVFCAFLRGLGRGGRAVGGNSFGGGGVSARPGIAGSFRPGGGNVEQRGVARLARHASPEQGMFGREHGEGASEEGVGAGGVDDDGAVIHTLTGDGEGHFRAFGTADPVALHGAHLVRPVDGVQVVGQALAVGGDAHHPLAEVALEHGVVAAFTAPVGGDFFVGQNRSQSGAPVHGGFADVGQAVGVHGLGLLNGAQLIPGASLRDGVGDGHGAGCELVAQFADGAGGAQASSVAARCFRVEPGVEDLEEDPLRPAYVVDVGGGQGAALVVGQTQATQLAAHIGDVFFRRDARVLAGLDCVLFGGQAEGVVAHGVQDVVPVHAVEAGDGVGCDVAQGVSDVQSLTRGVGEHVEEEERGALGEVAGQVAHGVVRVESSALIPQVLPLRFDFTGQGGGVAECGFGRGALAHGSPVFEVACARAHTNVM